MPKNSKKQIDIDEKKVIEELKKNSNKSINEIAKKCGFSRQKVWRIIKRLEKNNTIWGYSAVIDEEKNDLNTYVLLLKRSPVPVKPSIIENITSREIDDHIKDIGCEMITSMFIHGPYDWLIIFTAPDINQAKKVSELFRERYKQVLTEVTLIEGIFPVKIQGIVNPEIDKLKDFF